MTIIFCDNCGKPITSGMIIGLRGQNGYVDLCEKCTKLNLDINKLGEKIKNTNFIFERKNK